MGGAQIVGQISKHSNFHFSGYVRLLMAWGGYLVLFINDIMAGINRVSGNFSGSGNGIYRHEFVTQIGHLETAWSVYLIRCGYRVYATSFWQFSVICPKTL
jgi:hypothetical protein